MRFTFRDEEKTLYDCVMEEASRPSVELGKYAKAVFIDAIKEKMRKRPEEKH